MLISTGLKRNQIEALWRHASEAQIMQSDFFDILNRQGAASLLDEYIKKGVLVPAKPARAEMMFERMTYQDYNTPNPLFFTFSHGSAPPADIKNWTLSVEGDGVANPFSLSYDELLKLPNTTVTRYLECAGNGRAFFDSLLNKKAMGPQWRFGGYGIADWTGVKLAEILKIAGIRSDAVEVMPVGLDTPKGQRPMPVSKAMEDDTLLAYIMNGDILPPDHGFPLRALVPGWIGAANIKWVSKIIVSTKPIHVTANTTSFVLIGPDYTPRPPALGPVLTTQVVKSACCLPWSAMLRPGHRRITGYAWSPFGKIAKVEVSLDSANTFKPAVLTGPNIERAGTRWEFHFDAVPGDITIIPRATDDKGNTQYDVSKQKWNQLGYLWGAATPHPVTVSMNAPDERDMRHSDYVPPGGCC